MIDYECTGACVRWVIYSPPSQAWSHKGTSIPKAGFALQREEQGDSPAVQQDAGE